MRQRLLIAWFAVLLLPLACSRANADDEDAQTGVPLALRASAGQNATGSGDIQLPTSNAPPAPAPTASPTYSGPFGAAFRSAADPTRCLAVARDSTGKKTGAMTLATCTSSLDQQFGYGLYRVMSGAGGCLAVNTDHNGQIINQTPVFNANCAEPQGSDVSVTFSLTNVSSQSVAIACLGQGCRGIGCAASGAAACQLIEKDASSPNMTFFVTEPVGTAGVRILPTFGSSCLTRQDAQPVFAPCTPAGTGQLWKLSGHQLEADDGSCVVATDAASPLSLATCSRAMSLGAWIFGGLFLNFVSSNNSVGTLILPGTADGQPIVLQQGYQKLLDYMSFGPPNIRQ